MSKKVIPLTKDDFSLNLCQNKKDQTFVRMFIFYSSFFAAASLLQFLKRALSIQQMLGPNVWTIIENFVQRTPEIPHWGFLEYEFQGGFLGAFCAAELSLMGHILYTKDFGPGHFFLIQQKEISDLT